MDDNPILVDRRPGYRVITLNRPERLNAFNEAMQQALAAAITDAERDESCRALLLTGAGRAFSSGQDLNERVTATGDVIVPGEALEKYYNPLVRKLRALRFPVVAAVNGTAAGAACNIALACDIVLAARSATFLQAFARLGLVPDAGGTWQFLRWNQSGTDACRNGRNNNDHRVRNITGGVRRRGLHGFCRTLRGHPE